MKSKHFKYLLPSALAVAALCIGPSSVTAEETANRLSFDAATGLAAPAWQKTGEIEAKTFKEGDVSAVDLDDDSDTGRITYLSTLKPEFAAALKQGLVMEFKSKVLPGNAHLVALIAPPARLFLTLSANAKDEYLTCFASGKTAAVKTPAGAFHTWKIVWMPPIAGAPPEDSGSFSVFRDGEKVIEKAAALRGAGTASLTIGGSGNYIKPERIGRVLLQKFELRPATNKDSL